MERGATNERRAAPRRRLLALALSGVLLVALLLVGELLCRWLYEAPWLGNSRTLFVAEAFGPSAGNRPSSTEISFGVEVELDEHGFRIDPEFPGPARGPALLILGDSVGFGPGVVERDTFAGRMRRRLDGLRLMNSSVVGYSTHDYANVVEHFLPTAPEVERAYLVFCLNDVTADSARRIRESLTREVQGRAREAPPSEPTSSDEPRDFVATLRRTWVGRANELLRTRSKLYLFLKDRLTDPRGRYFFADRAHYVEAAEGGDPLGRFRAGMAPLLRVRAAMEAHGVDWTVVVLPYAAQLRTDPPSWLEPQERVIAFLEEHGIRHLDATATLAPLAGDGFLGGDPMHLSAAGHAALAELLLADLAQRSQ